ncbi:glycosyltransferase family protein [Halosimplex carlsbadense]|uniref:hypothetical protein n=1 Tax=Halosimplex carlsbadense TaxID=171164 RepID=UPI001268229D|nr:hypothetical protein [Halosimplex carlsbadense]
MTSNAGKSYQLYFAGLARDCEENLEENIKNILKIGRSEEVEDYNIVVAENDSKDNTKDILSEIKNNNKNFYVLSFDGIDKKYPVREERISHLRECLFRKIRRISGANGSETGRLYIPIDLDSKIAQSIEKNQFFNECERIINGDADAIFPVSRPYYYDIYALRAEDWVENNYWKNVVESKTLFGSAISKVRYKYLKQKHIDELIPEGRIPVRSAFGGVGIYNLEKLDGASYKLNGEYPQNACEHVLFNESIKSKEISTDFVVKAPTEHIQYKIPVVSKIKSYLSSGHSYCKSS